MEIKLDHRNLNLFHHFGDSAENENNTTRAFLIAITRSPWSPVLLRGFLDLLAERISSTPDGRSSDFEAFFRSWPETLEVSLERDISAGNFPGEKVASAILVALTPLSEGVSQIEGAPHPNPTGRVDATLIARSAERDALAIVVESKLYGQAGPDQLNRYRTKLQNKLIKTVLVEISWEEVYRLCEHLPQEAEHDPVLSDFKKFLARDARLVGFTGFRQEDFGGDPQLLDNKLQRLCERIAGTSEADSLSGVMPERKLRGLDYDLALNHQSSLVGNIGLASWGGDALHAKLVIGRRSRWHTDKVLNSTWNAEGVADLIQQVGRCVTIGIEAQVRPFFNRFDYNVAAQWSTEITPSGDAVPAWNDAVEFARSFHANPLDKEKVALLRSPPSTITDEPTIERALAAGVNCFVPFVLTASLQPAYIASMTPQNQLRTIRSKLVEMVNLLTRLSG